MLNSIYELWCFHPLPARTSKIFAHQDFTVYGKITPQKGIFYTMHLIHCYSTKTLNETDRQRLLDAASNVLEESFGADYALYYEELSPSDTPREAQDALYLLVASLPGEMPQEARAALSQKLCSALPGPQYIFFDVFPAEAAAPGGIAFPPVAAYPAVQKTSISARAGSMILIIGYSSLPLAPQERSRLVALLNAEGNALYPNGFRFMLRPFSPEHATSHAQHLINCIGLLPSSATLEEKRKISLMLHQTVVRELGNANNERVTILYWNYAPEDFSANGSLLCAQ